MKAVIPAAGLGTRLLPATKSMPKEMLPVVDKPVIQYVVEEAIAAGAEDILLVTGRGKRAIEDHFDHSFELEERLRERGKDDLYERTREISELAHVHYVRQPEPKGLGHAILCARRFVGDDPFLVLLGDDIVTDSVTPSRQLRDTYEERGAPAFSVMQVPRAEIGKYGSTVGEELPDRPGTYRVEDVVEKPDPEEAPSTLATMGRYVFTPRIFDYIEKTPPDEGGEIQLTDAMAAQAREEEMYAVEFEGTRLDVGTVEGFLEANVEMALRRDDVRDSTLALLRTIVDRESGS